MGLMPMDLVTALDKARRESGCMAASLVISTLPSLLGEGGVESYASALKLIHRLLKGWETYDGFVCRRVISRRAKELGDIKADIAAALHRILIQELRHGDSTRGKTGVLRANP